MQVDVSTEDVVLDLSFFWTDPQDAQDATSAALEKAQHVLRTSGTES